MILKTRLLLKISRRSIFVMKMAGKNLNGRYSCLTAGAVPAVSIMNGGG